MPQKELRDSVGQFKQRRYTVVKKRGGYIELLLVDEIQCNQCVIRRGNYQSDRLNIIQIIQVYLCNRT